MAERIVELPLDDVRTDGGTQPRVELKEEAIDDYAEQIAGGAEMDPVNVMDDGEGNLWLWHGFHRLEAHRKAGRATVRAVVREGSLAEARWACLATNQEHKGERLTNKDKRHKAEMALRLRPQMSDRALADHCGVSPKTVSKIRATVEIPQSSTRVGADGRTIDVSNISKRPADDRPRTVVRDQDAAPDTDPADDELAGHGTGPDGEGRPSAGADPDEAGVPPPDAPGDLAGHPGDGPLFAPPPGPPVWREKAAQSFGVLVRSLSAGGLYEKHRHALDAINRDLLAPG